MFQHFSFSNKTNASSRHGTIAATTDDENITEVHSTTPINFIVDDAVGTTTPETETMIIGHKLTYENETSNQQNSMITEALNNVSFVDTSGNDKKEHEDGDDDDEGSLLSVELDDLSGSILDNLPSTSHDNNNVDTRIDDDNSDSKGDTGINTDSAFFFEPIVQAMQEMQHQPNRNVLIVPLDHDDDDADDEILLLAPSPQRRLGTPKNLSTVANTTPIDPPTSMMKTTITTTNDSTLTQQNQRLMKRFKFVFCFAWIIVSALAYFSYRWTSPYVLEKPIVVISPSTSDVVYNFSRISQQSEYLIPIPSPTVTLLQIDEIAKDNSQHNVPTFTRMAHSIEPTIAKLLTDNMSNGGSKISTTSPPLLTVTGDRMSLPNFPLQWLPHSIIDFIVVIRYLPTFIHRIISWIIYTATLVVAGCVFVLLLAKFACMTWNNANLPVETDSLGESGVVQSTKRVDSRNMTTSKFTNVESLCEFIQSTQFSRTGRKPRSPAIKAKKDVYNKSCYELLSVDDLKCIGKFLQVSKLSKLQQKSNLINAIVAQYEISLQTFSTSDLLVLLSNMKMNDVKTSKKKDLIKLAIEVGF